MNAPVESITTFESIDQMSECLNAQLERELTREDVGLLPKEALNFITLHTSSKGMSGGPVFDINGMVYGMYVGTTTKKIKVSEKENRPLRNGVAISVEELNKALKNIK